MDHLTITASSSALFATWVFIEELDVLFDAGDGLSAGLMQRARKIKHIFISHADRDHVCGLLQFHQLNARDGIPTIYYPKDCGSFPALRDFMSRFDPQSGPATWHPLTAGDDIFIDENSHSVLALTSDHVPVGVSDSAAKVTKALRFVVQGRRRTLREKHRNLSGHEIARIRSEQGEDAITEVQTDKLVGYSGDASHLEPGAWRGVKILLHECTFLDPYTARRAHSNLIQVLEAASELDLEALILFHFSTRYTSEEITSAIAAEAGKRKLSFPVHAILPGELAHDLLSCEPIWPGIRD